MGDRAVLVELADLTSTLGFFDALRAADLRGINEAISAARTVLVKFSPQTISAGELTEFLTSLHVAESAAGTGRAVEIPVRYLGEDLAEVAELLGISIPELVRRHTGSHYRVAFGGFAPGFAYLTGGDPILNVPRRATPRHRIPAGSVGLAGTFSGVYPRESPGGWQLIGETDLAMWDLTRDPPATLQPGDSVHFVDVGTTGIQTESVGEIQFVAEESRLASETGEQSKESENSPEPVTQAVEIIHPGSQALLQDDGRPGMAGLGVAESGAVDRVSLHAANRLVGNEPGEAAIEFAYGGKIRAIGELVVAVSGAVANVEVTLRSGRVISFNSPEPIALGDGEILELKPTWGMYNYLAARGGFEAIQVLDSRSSDTMSGIGPTPLVQGSVQRVRVVDAPGPAVGNPETWLYEGQSSIVELPIILGPRDDWFTVEAIETLLSQSWRVTPRSNRVGLRLEGETALERLVTQELPSEGAVPGALQVPASGQPVLFLADHPVTGGYPVVAVLHSDALGIAAQLTPGTTIKFVESDQPSSSRVSAVLGASS